MEVANCIHQFLTSQGIFFILNDPLYDRDARTIEIRKQQFDFYELNGRLSDETEAFKILRQVCATIKKEPIVPKGEF
jgi:hypothetical protein